MSVSVVICCHNSALRLPETMRHLTAQRTPEGLAWEVVVVDNASTDDTAEVARSLWPESSQVPLRVVSEPRAGLSHARERGIAEARYELISFIDDDNWVCPDWVRLVAEIMEEHPEVGACGGAAEAAVEIELPEWFPEFQRRYAVGTQADSCGYVEDSRGWLWGAGLTVRRAAIRDLFLKGFQSQVTDRRGANLSSCGDIELCYAMRLAGWRLWYDPRLHLKHFLPKERLTWNYLRRLCRGSAASGVGLDAYEFLLVQRDTAPFSPTRTWQWQAMIAFLRLAKHSLVVITSMKPLQGHASVAAIEFRRGRLGELLRRRGEYNRAVRLLREARWIAESNGDDP